MIFAILAAVLGIVIAIPVYFGFNNMPEAWLQDYDYDPKAADFRLAKRMKPVPHMILIMAALGIMLFFAAYYRPELWADKQIFHMLACVLILPGLAIVVFSDALNRIIPDQIVVHLIILSVFAFLSDYLEGSLWFSAESPWYYPILNRVVGALIGSGLLLLIGFIASRITGEEALGMGDVKLLFAVGLYSGGLGLVYIIFISFILGGIVAIPLLVRKRMRIAAEEKAIRESDNPAKARKMLLVKKKEMHFADDPDYLAFGPFIAFGMALFMLFEPFFHNLYVERIASVLGLA